MGTLSVTLNPELFVSRTPLLYDDACYDLERLNEDLLLEFKAVFERGVFLLFTNRTIDLPHYKIWQIDSCETLNPDRLSNYSDRLWFHLRQNDKLRDISITSPPANGNCYTLQGYLDTTIECAEYPKRIIDGVVYRAEKTVVTKHQATLKYRHWLYTVSDAPVLSCANSANSLLKRC